MDKIRNLSVRKTILLYLSISLMVSFFLSAWIMRIASQVQEQIWWDYVEQDKYLEAIDRENENQEGTPYYYAEIPRPVDSEMSRRDYVISEFCDFLQTWTVLILSVTMSGIAVFLFYRNKLKQPIRELNQASRRIAENDLDFHITYENQDEMGSLCREFERMRGELAETNKTMWRLIEEEKLLRAAISHDIRSPLSILRGYQEMLMDYLPDGTIDVPKAVEMLKESKKQIERMDIFVETMGRMSSLEQRTMAAELITAKQMEADIQTELMAMDKEQDKQVFFQIEEISAPFLGDREVILEVTENLLSNALRYAKKQIKVKALIDCQSLTICVEDDGSGFEENLETVTRAFHQQNAKDSLKHWGMGMYISRLYCEKHGGKLLIENKETGGAVVTAVFCRIA